MGKREWGMGNREWGVGSGEWGIGSGEWGMGNREWGLSIGDILQVWLELKKFFPASPVPSPQPLFGDSSPTPYPPLPTPHSPLPIPHSPFSK
ncbi:MAG: hypothetical protein DSM106950_14525 [Stigonema ocellatum SAG 48.90 = DSM 106950]|nr:hypothetical protein [Stigonema ocellatum SAG 48.90 = DSM 106950]